MLELTRNKNEFIIIADNIKIKVLSDKYGQVRLGLEASEGIAIWREEIHRARKAP